MPPTSAARRRLKRLRARLPRWMFRSRRINTHDPGTNDAPVRRSTVVPGRAAARLTIDRQASRFYNFDESVVDTAFEHVTLYDGSPGTALLKNVWYFPDLMGLYSSTGERIDDACVRRGPDRRVWPDLPRLVALPKRVTRMPRRMIYVGDPFLRHYGHFLTESISRLWYATEDPATPLLCHDQQPRELRRNFIDNFYELSRIDRERFVSFRTPVILDEVVVPAPTMILRAEGFTRHAALPEAVAHQWVRDDLRTTEQPLFLSRTQLKRGQRRIAGEEELAVRLEQGGFAIAYPELLGLREQIELINRHDVVAGSVGSALHSILFNVTPNLTTVYFERRDRLREAYPTIDGIKSTSAVYIGALELADDASKPFPKQNATLDVDAAVDALVDVGLLER